jgi:hypothetical protein
MLSGASTNCFREDCISDAFSAATLYGVALAWESIDVWLFRLTLGKISVLYSFLDTFAL